LLSGAAPRPDKRVADPPADKTPLYMRRIIQANIDRFKELLKTETDPTKRAMEARLLAEEESKQKRLPAYDKDEKKAY
jgi:hypothetical protein